MADAIHDGPVQELIGLDMIPSSARKAAADGRGSAAAALLDEARELTERNIRALRDEIGPRPLCVPGARLRRGDRLHAGLGAALRLRGGAQHRADSSPPEAAGDLFRIAQEAVVNAGRHAEATAVSISLRTVDSKVELRVTDNGHGFEHENPLAPAEPGHIGLASMRERAELLGGSLEIETSERGTRSWSGPRYRSRRPSARRRPGSRRRAGVLQLEVGGGQRGRADAAEGEQLGSV